MEQEREKEKNYNPPGWLVTWFDQVKLDPERAQKFNDMRTRLCAALGKNNEACNPQNLWARAVDLLLANEGAILTKVEYFDVQGNRIEKPLSIKGYNDRS